MSVSLATLATAATATAPQFGRREAIPDGPSSRFQNISDAMLADMIGDQDKAVKAEESHLESLKAEAKRRGNETATGSRYNYTLTKGETKRLDTKALGLLLGDALDPYYKSTPTVTLRIKSVFEQRPLD